MTGPDHPSGGGPSGGGPSGGGPSGGDPSGDLARPYVTPQRLLEAHRRSGRRVAVPPKQMILAWQKPLLARLRAERSLEPLPGTASVLFELAGTPPAVFRLSSALGFALLPIGAPSVAIVLEELAALGVETVVGVGYAGGIGTELRAGDPVLCTRALRDEGTSRHYAPPERFAAPDPELGERLRRQLPEARLGATWTTDAPYRERVEQIARRREEGILTVDMEAAALFSVAAALGVAAASVFCVSDTLHGPAWEPHFHQADLGQALWELLRAVEECLGGAPPVP